MNTVVEGARPIVVLDTNVLLDWWVFGDPLARPLAQAIEAGQLDWIACESMRTEWNHVWPRSVFAKWKPNPQVTQAAFDRVRWVPVPSKAPWTCKDPDDQVFIDLAVAHQARWLISKDAAVLQMRKRMLLKNIQVCTLKDWSQSHSSTLSQLSVPV